jgi:hypothetical protein
VLPLTTGKAISLPGKAIGAVLARVRGDIPADSVAKVEEFHSLVGGVVIARVSGSASRSGIDIT